MKAIATIILSLALSPFSQAQTAEEIMSSVRQVAVLQGSQDLTGVIRKGSKKTPLTLFLRGKDIQFALNSGAERFHLRLNENNQQLREILAGGKSQPFPDKKIMAPISNTDVSYEDLALKFLYWANPRIISEEKLNGQLCWRLHVVNTEKTGRYREVSVWVTKNHRALMRVVGYGPRPASVPLKQFEITDVMKVNGVFTVETMKVSSFGEDRRVSGITYLEFEKPKRKAR
ncbi:MAG: hypothetical protein ACI9NQ_000657 [Paracoccaceae bacterium]|jgi:hypothetical protein